ncbi:MAG: glycosyltransferase [Heliobacteriaceae bacterium]|jgi:glycosyltransferase involved in cell wall biosynthesis|nr:glycosyltransferase [Heliobacteriaceae bacterium]
MPKISVIIPVYNTGPYLRRCLDSVLNQTLQDIEIICINDGSTDSSLTVLKEYAAKDSRVRVINFAKNKGAAAARNAGIKAATGEYIGFIDSDDYVDLDFYEKLYERMLQTGADIVKGADLKLVHPNGRIEVDKQNVKIKQNKLNFWNQYTSAIYRREFILKNEIEFPLGLLVGEDPVFAIKAAILADKVEVINYAQYYYCRREGSLNSEVWHKTKILSYAKYIETVMDFVYQSGLKDEDRKIIFDRLLEDFCWTRQGKSRSNPEYEAIFDELIAKFRKDEIKLPVKLLFDATTLANIDEKMGFRSGIFWVVFNLVKQFIKDKRFDVTLFLERNRKRPVLSKLPLFKDCKFVCDFYPVRKNNEICLVKNPNFNLIDYDAYFNGGINFDVGDNANLLPHFYFLYDTTPLLFKHYLYKGADFYGYYRNIFTKNTYYFCDSQSCKDDFLRFFPMLDADKMYVTPIATAQKFYPDKNDTKIKEVLKKYNIEYDETKKYLFSFCTLNDPRKQTLLQIECFLKFIKQNNIDDFYFYLGGSNYRSVYDYLKGDLGDLFDEDKIRVLGYVDDEDVNTLYSNSLFFTFVSLYEGFGMPPLEAMSAGVPVVTSNTSSLPEVVGDAAITVDPQDEEAIIKAYEALYFHPELREEYIQKGLERAKMFSWEKTYKLVSDKMLEVLT